MYFSASVPDSHYPVSQLKDVVLRKLRPASAAHVIIERLPPRRGVTPSLDWLPHLHSQGVGLYLFALYHPLLPPPSSAALPAFIAILPFG